MSDTNNQTPKKRNITGSYPGTYKHQSAPKPTPAPTQYKHTKKKESFDFKEWFSRENVKAFMKQLRFYGIIVVISLILSFCIINISNDVFAFIKPDDTSVVTIEENVGVSGIASALKKAGVIKHPVVFKLYAKLKKADSKFQHGTYSVKRNLSYDQIISKLKKASELTELFTFTVPEGATQDEITEMLVSKDYVDEADILSALNEHEYTEFEFTKSLPDRRCRLEGYLPAGDYEFYVGESAVSMVTKMLERFEETVLTDDNKKLIDKSELSLDEIITFSSLIQAECGNKDKYSDAASVLYNRLKSESGFLKLSCTINYVLPEKKQSFTESDKKTASEYNTYLYSGLPTGPVCTPSAEAVTATLNPSDTKYMYFISDGTKVTFNESEEEHRAKLVKSPKTVKGTETIV